MRGKKSYTVTDGDKVKIKHKGYKAAKRDALWRNTYQYPGWVVLDDNGQTRFVSLGG